MKLIPPPTNLPTGSRVWAYMRDSGGDNQEESVPQQEREIRAYCTTHGLLLEKTFADVAASGTSDVGRAAFLRMVDACTHRESNAPAAILYWSSARLARNETDAGYYRSILRHRGIILHSLTESIPSGPYAPAIEAMLDIANAEKSRQSSRDIRRGLEHLARAGYAPGGFPPRCYVAQAEIIGTRRNGKPHQVARWVPDPEIWELGKLAWRMRAAGHGYTAITKATGGRIFKIRHSWVTFFTNRTYLGICKFGDDEIPDHHPALVDIETWDAVQALAAERTGERHPSFTRSPSLLSGLAVCALCGAAMIQHRAGKQWRGYVCTRKREQGREACAAKMVKRESADEAVLNAVLTRVLTTDPNLIDRVRQQIADPGALEAEISRLRTAIGRCDVAIRNLLELAETFGAQSAAARLKERESERTRLRGEIAQAQERLAATLVEIDPATVEIVLARWRAQIKNASGDVLALRHVIREFVQRVELGAKTARIIYGYPSGLGLGTGLMRVPLYGADLQAYFSIEVPV